MACVREWPAGPGSAPCQEIRPTHRRPPGVLAATASGWRQQSPPLSPACPQFTKVILRPGLQPEAARPPSYNDSVTLSAGRSDIGTDTVVRAVLFDLDDTL